MADLPFHHFVAAWAMPSRRRILGTLVSLLLGPADSRAVVAGHKKRHRKRHKTCHASRPIRCGTRCCAANETCRRGQCLDHCQDGVVNFGETDVDCGGGCVRKCANGASCVVGADCLTGVCGAGGICRCLADGENCTSATQGCCSTHCGITMTGSTCRKVDCTGPASVCTSDTDCCDGPCTNVAFTGPMLCRRHDCLPANAHCNGQADCCNGDCVGNMCVNR